MDAPSKKLRGRKCLQQVRWFVTRLPFVVILLASGCGGGRETSELPLRFIVEVDQLPAVLAQPGIVLLAAASKDETKPLGYVNHAVLVDEDAWADFSFSADNGLPGLVHDDRAIGYR
jgi:hypothetical protein